MKCVFTIILLLLITSEIASSCQNDCCVTATQECQTCCQSNSNCCQTNTNCCQTHSNCCQRNSNCCHPNKNCCRTAVNCKSSDDCCKTAECKTQQSTEKTEVTVRPDGTVPTPEPQITVMNNSNSNRPNITFNLNINNNFTNVNHISNPISIKNDNQQQISVFFSMKKVDEISPVATTTTGSSSTTTAPSGTTSPPKETSTTTTKPCNPIPILIPMPLEVPKPTWGPLGCCMVVSPCLYGQDNCTPYKRVCGAQCTHNYMYQPFNPCESGGCYKRSFGSWNYCNYVGCRTRVVDCNYCQEDFYASYQGFNQCGGCYYL